MSQKKRENKKESNCMASKTLSMKLLVDTNENRVLFAEAGKDVVDFLFSILSLPVGTVIKLLTKQGMVGSLGNLYRSVETISDTYILSNKKRDTLLKPTIPNHATNIPLLLPDSNSSSTTPTKFYRCSNNSYSNCRGYIANYPNAVCPQCGCSMNQEMKLLDSPVNSNSASASNEGGFVKELVTYMVMDDLVVTPMSTISSITLLNKFNVKEVGALQEKVVSLGMDEGVKLLKASLQSKRVLSDVFLKEKQNVRI